MKSTVALIICALVVVGFATWLTIGFNYDSNLLIGYTMDIKEKCEQNDRDAATAAAMQFGELWNRCEHSWEFFVNHDDINGISLAYAELRHFLAEAELRDAESMCAQLILVISGVREKELPHITNIL